MALAFLRAHDRVSDMGADGTETFIEWDNERYSTEIERFDEQHKRLFTLLNDLYLAMEEGQSEQRVGDTLRELERYTEYHFGDEEEFMQDCGFAMDCADCFFNHREMHEEFAAKVKELRQKHEDGEYITMEMLMFARDWLDSHIAGLDQDQSYSDYYTDAVPEDYEYTPGKLRADRKNTGEPIPEAETPKNEQAEPVRLGTTTYEGGQVDVPEETLATWFERCVADHPDKDAAIVRTDETFTALTYTECREQAQALAGGLLECGVEPGDRVALHVESGFDWSLLDLACAYAGVVSVPLTKRHSSQRTYTILDDTDTALVVTDSTVPDGIPTDVDVCRYEELSRNPPAEFPGLTRQPEEIATVVYRFDREPAADGCLLTNTNIRAAIASLAQTFPVSSGTVGTCMLPLAHIYQRVMTYYLWERGAAVAYLEPQSVLSDLPAINPTVLVGVPQLYKTIQDAFQERQSERGGLRQRFASGLASTIGAHKNTGDSMSTTLSLKHRLAGRPTFNALRDELGIGELEYAFTSTTETDTSLHEFFLGIGVHLTELYGTTELTGIAAANVHCSYPAETVGRPLPGVTLALSEEAEILARGPTVTAGYASGQFDWDKRYRSEWFHTGDIGQFTREGVLKLIEAN